MSTRILIQYIMFFTGHFDWSTSDNCVYKVSIYNRCTILINLPYINIIVEIAEVDDHIKTAESKKQKLQEELDAAGDELQEETEGVQEEGEEEEEVEEEGLLDGLEEDGDNFLYDTGDGKVFVEKIWAFTD